MAYCGQQPARCRAPLPPACTAKRHANGLGAAVYSPSVRAVVIYTINHAPVRSVVVARGAAAERAHDETDFPAGRCTAPSRTVTRCRHRQCSPAVRRPHRRSTKARRHLFTGRSSRRTSRSSRCLDRSCWIRPCVTNPGGRAADGADPQVSDGRRRHEVRAAARSELHV